MRPDHAMPRDTLSHGHRAEQVALHFSDIRQSVVPLNGSEAPPEEVFHLIVELALLPILVNLHQRPFGDVGDAAGKFLMGRGMLHVSKEA